MSKTKEKLIDDIVEAWTNEGRAPVFHRNWQNKLRREWRTLANAIENLVREHKKEKADT